MKYLTTSILLAMVVSGCGTDTSDSGVTGSLSLNITDAPIDGADEVVLQMSQIEILGLDDSDRIEFPIDPPQNIDLLQLQGSHSQVMVDNELVPAGEYQEIRLLINAEQGSTDSYIMIDGNQHDLTVPSGGSSGFKVKGPFTIPANGVGSYTIDFDVRKSVVQSGNANANNGIKYHVKPVMRLVDNNEIGHIAGNVDANLLTDASCSDADADTGNAVYVYDGSGVTPDDIDVDEGSVEPVITALVNYNSDSGLYEYEAGYLLAGDYTIALTCNADLEDIENNEDLMFTGAQDVNVVIGETVTADF